VATVTGHRRHRAAAGAARGAEGCDGRLRVRLGFDDPLVFLRRLPELDDEAGLVLAGLMLAVDEGLRAGLAEPDDGPGDTARRLLASWRDLARMLDEDPARLEELVAELERPS
jgi:hypothetical protein